jgi:antitoxin VapB
MGLSIKNERLERSVRELAARRGMGITRVLQLAVDRELAEDAPPKKDPDAIEAVVREIQERWSKFPPINMQEMDDFLYDENGLPH